MKVFFDTNVLISAFAARGLCADLMRLVLAEHELQTGEVNLIELRRVLTERFKASEAQVDRVEDILRDHQVIAKPDSLLAIDVRDPDDAWVLASAVAASTDILVTGDKDLLTVASQSPVRILTPRDAWELLRHTPAS